MTSPEHALRVLVAAPIPGELEEFLEGLRTAGAQTLLAASGAEALALARSGEPALVVIAPDLPDRAPFGLVRDLLTVNAAVAAAVISPLSEDRFHEAGEGLGILARLPLRPGRGEALRLLGLLTGIS